MCNLRTTVYLTQLAMPCLQIYFPTAEAGHCPSTYSPGAPLSLYIFIFVVLSHCLLRYNIETQLSCHTQTHTPYHSPLNFPFHKYTEFCLIFVVPMKCCEFFVFEIMGLCKNYAIVGCNSLTCYIFAL